MDRGEWLDTDVWRFDDLWSAATQADRLGNASVALDSMHRAVALWRGDPSELANEDWPCPRSRNAGFGWSIWPAGRGPSLSGANH